MGTVHWGHAVSKDLIHWEHLPIALYPDEIGTMYSGSMAYDENNTSGFAKYGEKPMVAVYTAHNMETGLEQQCIAYSLDQGKHFEKYYGNPVIKTRAHRISVIRASSGMTKGLLEPCSGIRRPRRVLCIPGSEKLEENGRVWCRCQ